MADAREYVESLLSTTTVDLSGTGQTTLFTVPTGKTAVLTKAVIRVGADAGASVITIGRSTALDDFLDFQDLSNLDANGDVGLLRPSVPDEVDSSGDKAVVEVLKTYAAGVIIQADVVTALGGATNYIDLFGYLF